MDEVEGQIWTKGSQKTPNQSRKKETIIRDLLENTKPNNIKIIGAPEEGEQKIEKLLEEIITEKFLNPKKTKYKPRK